MEATNETGTKPAGAEARAGEAGPKLSVGLAVPPEDCVCEPLSWFGEMKPICDDYLSDEGHSQCKRCEHDKGCHKAANV